jgi:5-oxoprolinase (ATP-hydrolysing)
MCRPIRSLTEGRGYDARTHRLAVFGGAGGQHACPIARNLNIGTVIIHKYSSILSAYGMALAEVVQESLEPSSEVLTAESLPRLRERLDAMKSKVKDELLDQGFTEKNLRFEPYLNLRYSGTDTSLMIMEPNSKDFEEGFLEAHLREFTFTVPGRPILVDDLRVRGMATDVTTTEDTNLAEQVASAKAQMKAADMSLAQTSAQVYFEEIGRVATPIFILKDLPKGSTVAVSHIARRWRHEKCSPVARVLRSS